MTDNYTDAIRQSYDRIVDEYARRIHRELEGKPSDRDILSRFAKTVEGSGEICDLGCGPGHVTQYLHSRGVTVFGLDISTRMVEQAQRLNPGMRFQSGDMFRLDIPDGALAGIVAFYSMVNMAPESLPALFGDVFRVVQVRGPLLLAFHIGEEAAHYDELWGHGICLDFSIFNHQKFRRYLEEAGFEIEEMTEREPYAPEVEHRSRRAYILARRPSRHS